MCGAMRGSRRRALLNQLRQCRQPPRRQEAFQQALFEAAVPHPALSWWRSLDLEESKHSQTILAYEMNGAPLTLNHRAPLRLRVETKLGFKIVKWIKSIELVEDYKTILEGKVAIEKITNTLALMRKSDRRQVWSKASILR